jgi:FKBP-type peptidyl-prolyl cis-trans isomerase FklB
MKKSMIWAVVLVFSMLSFAFAADKAIELKTQKDKVSYSIGLDIGNSFKKQAIDVDLDILLRAIKDVMSEAKPLMTDTEVQETMQAFQKEMMAKMQEKAKVDGEKNKKAGDDFLAANKAKEGVVTLPSGLQYKVITDGKGEKPKSTDTVTVNYKGTLIDGTEFDSSFARNEPATFPVTGVIPGWTEALQLMKTGAKWQLFIPSNLAYGERNAGEKIGPNSTLVFEVELISINPPADKAPADKAGPAPATVK